MNRNSFNPYQIRFSGLGFWLVLLIGFWLLGAIGLGWLVNSILILFGLILLAPIVIFIGFRWWFQRNLVQDSCPVCSYEFAALNHNTVTCPSCGETLEVENKHFVRVTPPGTIDVDVVDVSASADTEL